MAELIDHAKREPGKIDIAHAGVGNPFHPAAVLFQQAAGIKLNEVPYRGARPAVQGLLGGDVHMMFVDYATARSHIAAGALKALGVAALTPRPELPGIEYRQISGELVGLGRARNWDDALLDEITQCDLRGGLAVSFADARENVVAGRLAASKWAVGRDRQPEGPTRREHLVLGDKRMNLDLVNGLLQQGCGEIRDSDMFGSAIAFSLAQNVERLLERHFRIWPMEEEKIDPGELELFEALIERALDVRSGISGAAVLRPIT